MRISQKLEYAFRAIAQLAKQHDGRTLTRLDDIAQREAVSRAFLLQILNDLRRSGIVRSTRGPSGGYILARQPSAITLRDIVEATEPAMLIPSPVAEGESGQAVKAAWEGVSAQWNDLLAKVTIDTLATSGSLPMFFI